MPRLKGTLAKLDFKLNVAKAKIEQDALEILRDGAQAWVRAIADAVPVWSGMSLASLKPIADLVGISLNTSPVSGAPDRQSKGRALGSATFEDGPTKFSFSWESNVFHYLFNEFNDARPYGFHLIRPGPYYSVRKAEGAFFKEVNPRLRRLFLSVANAIEVTRAKIG